MQIFHDLKAKIASLEDKVIEGAVKFDDETIAALEKAHEALMREDAKLKDEAGISPAEGLAPAHGAEVRPEPEEQNAPESKDESAEAKE